MDGRVGDHVKPAPPAATVGALLAAISDGAPVASVLIGSWDSLLPLSSMLADIRALGVTIAVTPAASGKLVCGRCGRPGPWRWRRLSVTVAEHANILLDDGGSPAGTTICQSLAKQSACRFERNGSCSRRTVRMRSHGLTPPQDRRHERVEAAHLAAFRRYKAAGLRVDGLSPQDIEALKEDPEFVREIARTDAARQKRANAEFAAASARSATRN